MASPPRMEPTVATQVGSVIRAAMTDRSVAGEAKTGSAEEPLAAAFRVLFRDSGGAEGNSSPAGISRISSLSGISDYARTITIFPVAMTS